MKLLTKEQIEQVENSTIRLYDSFPIIDERQKRVERLKLICLVYSKKLGKAGNKTLQANVHGCAREARSW